MKDFIMQMRPHFGDEEKKAICSYMDEDGFITEFKRTAQFEEMIADFTGAKFCVVVNNGTISLTIAALSLGIKAGDEVIVPNYTMVATPNSIQMIGAKPIFVDVEPETLCLDINLVEKAITPKTKAIMLVSANGRYPKSSIEAFQKLSKLHDIKIIEDAAQSLGSYYPDGGHIGTAGDVGSFSFSAPKIISTGQGGALITNNEELANKIRKLKDFGRSGGGNDIHDVIGYNFKFTELQACIGIEQMKKLPSRIELKKKIWSRYNELLETCSYVETFNHNLNHTAPWFIDVTVDNREELINFLKTKNIGSRPMYPPINEQLAYSIDGFHPISKFIGEFGLWLPSFSHLTDDQIKYITISIHEFYR